MNGLGPEKMEQKRTQRHLPLSFLLLGVGIFHVLTMPNFHYMGDNLASRAEAANLLNTGKLGIPFSQKGRLADLARQRGQYFYENNAKQVYYSKYGTGYTLLYLVPLSAEKWYSGKLDLLCVTRSQLTFLNLYNVIFTLLATAYLYRIVSLYTSKTWQRIGFILISYYTTFFWHYLRSPTTEVFQLFPFLGFHYHLACFLRQSRLGLTHNREMWKSLTMAVFFAGLLLFTKPIFALLFIVVGVFATTVPGWTRLRQAFLRAFRNVSEFKRQYFIHLILPSFLFVGFLLAVNHYKFGFIFSTGYGQWVTRESKTPATGIETEKTTVPDALESKKPEDDRDTAETHETEPVGWGTHEVDRFASNPLVALYGFFLARGNANAFVHYPVFLFALFGMKRFAKKFPFDFCLILSLFGLITLGLASYSGWEGGWCYGPRYLLPVLVVGSLPFLEVMDRMVSFKPLMKWCAIGLVACVLSWSLVMQVYVNSLYYFVFYTLSTPLKQSKQEKAADAYFRNCFHRGLIHRDFILYIKKGKPFFPLEAVKRDLSPRNRDLLSEMTQRHRLAWMAESNYFFCSTRKGTDSR